MILGQFLFVQHLKGEFEGTKYNYIKVSDGVRIIKLKNSTGTDDFLEKGFVPEKTRVEIELKISSNKETATVEALSMKAIKA